jgi:uncharacterized protein YoxC
MSDPSESHDPFDPTQFFDQPDHNHNPSDPIDAFEPLVEDHVEPVLSDGLVEELPAEGFNAFTEPEEAPVPLAAPTYDTSTAYSIELPPYSPPVAKPIAMALVLGTLFVGSAAGISILNGTQPAPPAAPAAATAPAAPAEDPSKATATKVDGIKTEVDGLTKKVEDVSKLVAALPKSELVDLKPIETKIADLGKKLSAMPSSDTKGLEAKLDRVSDTQTDLIQKLNAINAQANGLAKALAAETGERHALETKLKAFTEAKPKVAEAAASTTTPALARATTPAGSMPAASNAVTSDADYEKAVETFKKSLFGPAKEQFTKLTEANSTDARVWYYAALSNGFATNAWTGGDTEKFVQKAMTLEKSSSPDTAKIDAAFADLPASTKAWLDYYRKQIVK